MTTGTGNAPTGPAEPVGDKSVDGKKVRVKAAAYNATVASAALRDIKLVQSEFFLDPEGLSDPSTWDLNRSCEIDNSYYDADNKFLIAWVDASATGTKDEKDVVSLKCRYVVFYKVDGQPDELVVTHFAKRVARFAVYPYFRAHFAGIAAQAGLHIPPLPIIREKRDLQTSEPEKDKGADPAAAGAEKAPTN